MISKRAFIKRLFDLVLAIVALLALWWVILIAWLASLVTHNSNGFFVQERVGLNGKLFKIIKLRTMVFKKEVNTTITTATDIRITSFGHFLRKYKIDELPQIFNVIKGEMSFVGPRPDVPGYADVLQGKDRLILAVRPGITGPAQLVYKNEELLLENQRNPIQYNDEVIWPDKVRINKEYVENYTFSKDIYYILKTIVS
jgi:lipopolysaccharide/colanic/teichoic acid biosynthesis glycosyltransferase